MVRRVIRFFVVAIAGIVMAGCASQASCPAQTPAPTCPVVEAAAPAPTLQPTPTQEPMPATINDDDWSKSKKEVTLSTGFRMRYVEAGSPDAPTLILLHGLTDSSRSWELAVPYLKDKYHLLIPDQRGHGDSEKPATGYSIPSFAADVAAFMDALKIEKAVVAGHSMGSFIASEFAIDYPERVEKVILVSGSATSVGNATLTDFVWATIPTLTEPIDPTSQFIKDWTSNPYPVDEAFIEHLKPETAAVPLHVWRGATQALLIDNHSKLLKEIKAPALILWGEQDSIFLQSDQIALTDAMPAATFKAFPETGHNMQWEKPEAVSKDMIAFIDGGELSGTGYPWLKTVNDDEWSKSKKEVALATGFRMRYVEAGPADAPAVILLHGLTDSSRSWELTVPYLKDKFHLFIPDQRGHGDSEKPATGYTIPSFADDVIAFMDALKIEKASIVGHSMGSFIAQEVALDYPERVEKVILIATAPTSVGNVTLTDFVWATIPTLSEPIDPESQFIKDWTGNPNPVDENFIKHLKPETAAVPLHVWKGATKALLTDNHSWLLKDITAPTLVLWGDQDSIFLKADQDAMAKLMPAATFKTFEKVGHNVQWEQPKLAAEAIVAFLLGQSE